MAGLLIPEGLHFQILRLLQPFVVDFGQGKDRFLRLILQLRQGTVVLCHQSFYFRARGLVPVRERAPFLRLRPRGHPLRLLFVPQLHLPKGLLPLRVVLELGVLVQLPLSLQLVAGLGEHGF